MSNAATAKPKSRRPGARKKLPGHEWMGCAKGLLRIRPGVDLTKPTLPPGKYFT